jgi:hypothetical protein
VASLAAASAGSRRRVGGPAAVATADADGCLCSDDCRFRALVVGADGSPVHPAMTTPPVPASPPALPPHSPRARSRNTYSLIKSIHLLTMSLGDISETVCQTSSSARYLTR